MAKRYYRPELDALRFFAFACVFCNHLPILGRWFKPVRDSGTFGMCMFFMLSAYFIITILLREKETTGKINQSAFAARRVLRIWPFYFLVLFAGYILGLYFPDSAHVSGQALLAFSFLFGNVYIVHHGWLGPIGPLWSLSVEKQFYLAVPAIVRLGGRRGIIVIGITAHIRPDRRHLRIVLSLLRAPHPQVQRTLRNHPYPPGLVTAPSLLS